MTAFNFKRRFVGPIMVGLGLRIQSTEFYSPRKGLPAPKRQTIRAIRKDGRTAPIGGELQLYCAQRSPAGFLIGRARCIGAFGIILRFATRPLARGPSVGCNTTARQLDRFAQADGFADWSEMRAFWEDEHDGIKVFDGTITHWQAIT